MKQKYKNEKKKRQIEVLRANKKMLMKKGEAWLYHQ